MQIDSEILKKWIKDDKEKCQRTYGNSNIVAKGFVRSIMLIEELEKETQGMITAEEKRLCGCGHSAHEHALHGNTRTVCLDCNCLAFEG